jgi:hypothetical protein
MARLSESTTTLSASPFARFLSLGAKYILGPVSGCGTKQTVNSVCAPPPPTTCMSPRRSSAAATSTPARPIASGKKEITSSTAPRLHRQALLHIYEFSPTIAAVGCARYPTNSRCVPQNVPPCLQVQRRYLKADLPELRRRRAGLLAVIAAAITISSLDIAFGFMTVPHEFGHVWAAHLVGNRVTVVQVDFLSKTSNLQDTLSGSRTRPRSPAADGEETPAQDATKDGRLGYVLYEPSVILVTRNSFGIVAEYDVFAGAPTAVYKQHRFVICHPRS